MADANGAFMCHKYLKRTLFLVFASVLLTKEVLSLTCYCAGVCPNSQPNGTCLARPHSQCFSAVEQVYNHETGLLENERTYGCLPPEEGGLMQCKGHLVPHQIPKSIACCSNMDLCNKYLTPNIVIRPTTPNPLYNGELMTYNGPYHLITFVAAASVCILIIQTSYSFLFCLFSMKNRKESRRSYIDGENCKSYLAGDSMRNLIDKSNNTTGSGSGAPLLVQRTIGKQIEMIQTIGRGRFGEVLKARLRDEFVAVKVFFTSEEASWARETDIYKTVLLRHENILGFVAADVKGTSNWIQMLLITDYHELGSLHDYLRVHMLDIRAMLRLAHSATKGINHLHTEVLGKQGKPAIAHRDIKSRNILIKRDGTCAIADFGLAVKYKSESNELDLGTNTRVGTRRYMAPEVLDATLDPSQFEAYKRSDIYSFALVLWEIARRCIVNGIVEEYQLPYYEYVPTNPSFEDMRKVVCVDQIRPTIPKHWSSCEFMQGMSKIIQESWNKNPGARIAALRIKKDLKKLEDRYQDLNKDEKLV
ncbi:bone morphogenetic protein receptor type-1B-like [Uloborus diversus]|uniref:bone morphogenetic protein receptor type-1B-like n=1 Tax=Uloborus diversus TaxID=327109 RepID=UPI00240901C5|nr:bone morphogenetic protein receptor type-1B-like [Uloborus diversus]